MKSTKEEYLSILINSNIQIDLVVLFISNIQSSLNSIYFYTKSIIESRSDDQDLLKMLEPIKTGAENIHGMGEAMMEYISFMRSKRGVGDDGG